MKQIIPSLLRLAETGTTLKSSTRLTYRSMGKSSTQLVAHLQRRGFLSTHSARSDNGISSQNFENTDDYESPLQELFDQMDRDVTAIGTVRQMVQEPKRLECGIPVDALRFTSTSYGRLLSAPYVHPNEHRVTMKVGLHHLPLNETEMQILREIVGNRIEESQLRISSNQFGSRIENKRHLVSMLERIIQSCKTLGETAQQQQG